MTSSYSSNKGGTSYMGGTSGMGSGVTSLESAASLSGSGSETEWLASSVGKRQNGKTFQPSSSDTMANHPTRMNDTASRDGTNWEPRDGTNSYVTSHESASGT